MATTYGWVTLAEADAYFALRIGSSPWQTSGADQEGALTLAYNMINAAFTIPSAITDVIKMMQYEQALFLLYHEGGMDRRMGLRAQGVVVAGIVKERYLEKPPTLPICPMAKTLGAAYGPKAAYLVEIDRDEEEGI